MWKGIDVSDNQGAINWAQIPKNVDFAILRSVRRSGKADHQFAANLEGCRKRNIPMSVYKYTYAATPEAARQEAQQVVALLQSYGLTGTMVWWDVEDKDVLRPLGAAKLTECIRAAQEVITSSQRQGTDLVCISGCMFIRSVGLTLMRFLEHGCGWLDTTKAIARCCLPMSQIRAISHRLIDGLRYGSIRAVARLQASKAMLI